MTKSYEYNKRWRYKHPEKRRHQNAWYYGKTAYAPNSNKRFTKEEIEMIISHNVPDSELAEKLERSVRSIQIARSRYKKKGTTVAKLYVKKRGDTVVGYAYGEEWVAQALFMDDWCYDTPEEAKAAWGRYLKEKNNG